jgi:NodT family efflux transporter outer membrane factor (OMF) lipoprotein
MTDGQREPAAFPGSSKFSSVRIVALASLVMASGCAVGPHFERPAAPFTGYPTETAQVGAERLDAGADVPPDWYRLFGAASLNALVQEALRANPDLEAARRSLIAARYELEAVAGSALPQIELDTKAMRARVNGSFLYEPIEKFQATANVFTIGPSLAYDLDVFGRLRRTIEAQTAQTAQIAHQTLNVRITLVSNVVLTAFEVAAATEQIEVTRKLVEDNQAQYELTRKLEEGGKGTRSDTLQALSQLESTRAELPGLRKQLDTYRNALLRLLGSAPTDHTLPPIALKDFDLPAKIPVSLPSQLVRQRPDILEAEDLLHQASAQVGVAEAARFPDFQLTAQYAQQSEMLSDIFSKAGQIWTAGLNVTAPIFEGGRLRAREKEARQRFLQVAAQYRGTLIDAFVEVANALEALERDGESYAARTTSVYAARANRDLERLLFERGKVSELVVLTAEEQYQNAALEEVRADVQRFSDVAQLLHALGGGWWNDEGSGAAGARPAAGEASDGP